jgi:hypothetical protein
MMPSAASTNAIHESLAEDVVSSSEWKESPDRNNVLMLPPPALKRERAESRSTL